MLKSGFVNEPGNGFGIDNSKKNDIKGQIRQQHIADEKQQIEHQVFSFDMADFMSNDGIDFFWIEHVQQGRSNQYITKFFNEPHDAGGNHFTAEYGPVKNIRIGQIRFLA